MLYTCRLRPGYRRIWVTVCVLVTFFALLLLVHRGLSFFGSTPTIPGRTVVKRYDAIDEKKSVIYGLVIDAGSTGSRLHVFRFLRHAHPKPHEDRLELLSEDFHHVKPGLSHYADNPQRAAASLKPLLQKARALIPPELWSRTVTLMQATAGLRLLPKVKSDAIIDHVRSYLESTNLYLPTKDAVSIMDGINEGLTSWITLNYLTHRLSYPASSHGALDLGGGSTQVTFLPVKVETLHSAPKNFIITSHLGSKEINYYTNSYLGLGLMSARHQMMGGTEAKPSVAVPERQLSSPCLPPKYKGIWRHGGRNYLVRTTTLNGFASCYESAQGLVTELYSVDNQREMWERSFYAFSYFFDRAVDAGLIPKNSPGRVLTVKEFKTAAENECATNTDTRPYLCMDLCYITALFLHGYRFKEDTKLHVAKKINNVELSWCLGRIINVLYSLYQDTDSSTTVRRHVSREIRSVE